MDKRYAPEMEHSIDARVARLLGIGPRPLRLTFGEQLDALMLRHARDGSAPLIAVLEQRARCLREVANLDSV